MAVAPSSNLLSALSQLQGPRPAQAPRAPQAAQNSGATTQPAPTRKTSFAAQLGSVGNGIQVAAADQRSTAPAPQSLSGQSQSRPIPTKGGLLGQHVNILA